MKLINDYIKEIVEFKKLHPTAFFYKGKDRPTMLQYIIEVVTEDGYEKSFIIPLGVLTYDRVTRNQHKIIKNYLDTVVLMNNASKDFVSMFTLDLN